METKYERGSLWDTGMLLLFLSRRGTEDKCLIVDPGQGGGLVGGVLWKKRLETASQSEPEELHHKHFHHFITVNIPFKQERKLHLLIQ